MVDLKIKAVFFDFMGTCLDCHSGVIQVLPQSITKLALEWRHDYFNANAARLAANEPPKNIDITLRNTLDALLKRYPEYEPFDESSKQHHPAAAGHGTTRLQLDLCQSSGLRFNMLFSSELLGVYKPAPESYRRTLELINVEPQESVMVAAHAYDFRGAKAAGMKTVYIHRWSDGIREDMQVVERENDYFLEDMTGLVELVRHL